MLPRSQMATDEILKSSQTWSFSIAEAHRESEDSRVMNRISSLRLIIAALLAVCVMVAGASAWGRSHFKYDQILMFPSSSVCVLVVSADGALTVSFTGNVAGGSAIHRVERHVIRDIEGSIDRTMLGRFLLKTSYRGLVVTFPFWLLLAVVGTVSGYLIFLPLLRRNRRFSFRSRKLIGEKRLVGGSRG